MNRPIFLDNQATTALDPAVLDAMTPFFGERYGNPHSLDNEYGRDVAAAVDKSRQSLASSINAEEYEIFYTSGATESNNWLVHNINLWSQHKDVHIILSEIEHASLIEPIRHTSARKLHITWLSPDKNGLISVEEIERSIQQNTVLISVMAVNNEIGVIQPLQEIGALCARHGILFHSDAAQAVGKIALDVQALNLDFVSLSSHKAYGPMGIGALYISSDNIKHFEPMILGGGQQNGLRSGTLPVPLCIGFGKAYELASQRYESDEQHLRLCRDLLLESLKPYQDLIKINGCLENRIAGNLNFQFTNQLVDHFLVHTPSLAFSKGSACITSSNKSSSVLSAIGLNVDQIERSFRLSLARTVTIEEVDVISKAIVDYLRQ